ncbi:MAG: glycosyltransferase family 2 protein [Myxococcaceae bacterium]|nr:glycosyltransferase family 2 protein [Myxococcaceae bacterium]
MERSGDAGHVELSAVVMVFNERKTIARCLDALVAACDEVVVVDDVSTDGTWEYLQSRGDVRAVQHKHTTFAAQREYGKSLARGRWVLTMDADEYVSPALAAAIRQAIRRPDAPDGFYIWWRTPYPPSLVGASWSKHPRLVRTDRCRWVQTDNPHSPLDMTGLRMEVLSGAHMEHAPLPNLATALRKSINRSLIVATQERAVGRRTNGLKLFGSTLARFLKMYVRGGAWRHGTSGFIMACAAAFEAFAKQAFLYETPLQAAEQLQDGGPGSYPQGTRFASPRAEAP